MHLIIVHIFKIFPLFLFHLQNSLWSFILNLCHELLFEFFKSISSSFAAENGSASELISFLIEWHETHTPDSTEQQRVCKFSKSNAQPPTSAYLYYVRSVQVRRIEIAFDWSFRNEPFPRRYSIIRRALCVFITRPWENVSETGNAKLDFAVRNKLKAIHINWNFHIAPLEKTVTHGNSVICSASLGNFEINNSLNISQALAAKLIVKAVLPLGIFLRCSSYHVYFE